MKICRLIHRHIIDAVDILTGLKCHQSLFLPPTRYIHHSLIILHGNLMSFNNINLLHKRVEENVFDGNRIQWMTAFGNDYIISLSCCNSRHIAPFNLPRVITFSCHEINKPSD